jgi:DnaK suppressor protein
MQNQELLRYEMALKAKEAELRRMLRRRDSIVIEKSSDLVEDSQLAAQRDLATRSCDLDWALLRQVRAALERIADGTYGICLHCDEPISPKRLQALPWASYCVRCQEMLDREQRQEMDIPGIRYASAAMAA